MKTRFAHSIFAAAALLCAPVGLQQAEAQLAVVTNMPEGTPSGERGEGVPEFWVRPGYKVTLEAKGHGESRFLEIDDKANVYLSQPSEGRILTFRVGSKGTYEKVGAFVEGFGSVHGMHFKDGWLWFTQSGAVHKGRDTNGDGKADEIVTVVPEGQLPSGGGHWWRSILVGDDGFYTSIGDSGNISDETKTERQKIWKFSLDGKTKTQFATGLRNTEKLQFRPGTKEVWGADHGSDWFGKPIGDRDGRQPITDWNPPDEFNHYEEGKFYGHPFVVGNKLPRVESQKRENIIELVDMTTPPGWCFGAHWATNGFTFLKGTTGLAGEFDGDAIVACHGSWNRESRAGYRLERVLFDKVSGKPYGSQMLVGTLKGRSNVLGRPVDVVELPDGSVLWTSSSDRRIYRLSKVAGK